MILCSKLKIGLCKIVTKSQVITKFKVTISSLHCTYLWTERASQDHKIVVVVAAVAAAGNMAFRPLSAK